MCKAVHVNEREKVWGWCVREIWREIWRERGMDKAWQQIDTNASSKMNELMFKRVSICHLLAQISTWIQCVVINILCSLPLSTWISLSLSRCLSVFISSINHLFAKPIDRWNVLIALLIWFFWSVVAFYGWLCLLNVFVCEWFFALPMIVRACVCHKNMMIT